MTFEDLKNHFSKRGFDVHGRHRGKSGDCHLVASIRGDWDYGDKKCRTFFAAKLSDGDSDQWIRFKFSVSGSALASDWVKRMTNDPEAFLLQAGLLRFKRFLSEDDSPGRSGDYMVYSGSSEDEFIMHDPEELRSEVAHVRLKILDLLWQNRHLGIKRTSKQAMEDAACAPQAILDSVLDSLEQRELIKGAHGSSGIKITVEGEVELDTLMQNNSKIQVEAKTIKKSKNTLAQYDVFISHASEDKDVFVRSLAQALHSLGLRVWYDEFTLKLGDSLRESIDRGLAGSRYGLVVLSHNFFSKTWPQRELNGLFSTMISDERRILPIWHELSAEEVKKYSPMLSDLVAANSSEGVEAVAKKVLEVCSSSD